MGWPSGGRGVWKNGRHRCGARVVMFTLDRAQGSFALMQEHVKIHLDTKEFAINMSNMRHWDAPVKRYIDEGLQGKEGPRGNGFNIAGLAAWWPMCTASSPEAAASGTRGANANLKNPESCV